MVMEASRAVYVANDKFRQQLGCRESSTSSAEPSSSGAKCIRGAVASSCSSISLWSISNSLQKVSLRWIFKVEMNMAYQQLRMLLCLFLLENRSQQVLQSRMPLLFLTCFHSQAPPPLHNQLVRHILHPLSFCSNRIFILCNHLYTQI